jgi:hypothetical protein
MCHVDIIAQYIAPTAGPRAHGKIVFFAVSEAKEFRVERARFQSRARDSLQKPTAVGIPVRRLTYPAMTRATASASAERLEWQPRRNNLALLVRVAVAIADPLKAALQALQPAA